MSVYEPREDSKVLIDEAKKLVKKGMKVLDVGTGSGEIVKELLEKTGDITGADINPYSIDHCRKNIPKAKFIQSDLFNNIEGKFDVITFNPPYLPEEKKEDLETALQVAGGTQGYELLLRFMDQAKNYLKKNGFIITIFSSLTKPDIVFDKTKTMGYKHEVLASKELFLEKLYCVKFMVK
jgi:release factor glutamine methyltransferase